VPVGSDFTLEAVLTLDGALSPSRVTSSGTFRLTVSDSVLNGGSALLTDRLSDSVTASAGLVKWNITDSQSSGWEAGTYDGDIKLVDSGGTITYWPVSLKVRAVKD
jgi:hypothetical protein